MPFATKHDIHGAFSASKPIEVPAPELGDGVVVRFKAEFTVDDLVSVVSVDGWKEPLMLELILGRLALLDEEGRPMVDPKSDDWFQRGINGVHLVRWAKRAGLAERFTLAFREREGTDSEAVTEERIRRVVADLSTAMKLSPDTVRKWALSDLMDVLESFTRKAEK